MVYLLLFLLWFGDNVSRRQNELNETRNELNDERLITQDAEKAYICSKKTQLVCWEDIEEHCHDAEAKGWRATMEELQESRHVRQVKVDPDRYWAISRRLLMHQPRVQLRT